MMKLLDILKEDDEEKKKAAKAKPAKPKAKAATTPAAPPKDNSIAQSADRMIANFGKNKSQAATPNKPAAPADKPVPSLASLAKQNEPQVEPDPLKGFPKFDQEPEEHPFGHPEFFGNDQSQPEDEEEPQQKGNMTQKEPDQDLDFLKHVQKGLSNVDSPAAQAADRIANNMYQRPEQQPLKGADKPPPSLASLARDIDNDDEKDNETDKEDDLFKDFPTFNDEDSEEWNQNPFGDPDSGQNPDFRTGIQKGADAIGQGLKAASQKIGQTGKQLGKKIGQKASDMFKKDKEVPQNWEPGQKSATEPDKADDSPMPSMSNVAKQGLQGKHWQWKPGQKVDIGFVKDLEVMKTDQYGAQLKSKNGSIYRFIPHRGLRKIS
jgi:hypothetical protein